MSVSDRLIAKLRYEFSIDDSKMKEGASSVRRSLDELGSSSKGVNLIMAALTGGIGGVAFALTDQLLKGITSVAEALPRLTEQVHEHVDALVKMKDTVGGTVEQMSELEYVGQLTQADMGSLGQAMRSLAKAATGISDEGVKTTGIFRDLGIGARDVADSSGNMVDLFVKVIGGLHGITDETKRMEDARQLLGRGMLSLMPMISKLSAQDLRDLIAHAHELGGVVGEDLVGATEQLHKATVDVRFASQGLAQDTARSTMPAMTDFKNLQLDIIEGYRHMEQGAANYGAEVGRQLDAISQQKIPGLPAGSPYAGVTIVDPDPAKVTKESLAALEKQIGLQEKLAAAQGLSESIHSRINQLLDRERAAIEGSSLAENDKANALARVNERQTAVTELAAKQEQATRDAAIDDVKRAYQRDPTAETLADLIKALESERTAVKASNMAWLDKLETLRRINKEIADLQATNIGMVPEIPGAGPVHGTPGVPQAVPEGVLSGLTPDQERDPAFFFAIDQTAKELDLARTGVDAFTAALGREQPAMASFTSDLVTRLEGMHKQYGKITASGFLDAAGWSLASAGTSLLMTGLGSLTAHLFGTRDAAQEAAYWTQKYQESMTEFTSSLGDKTVKELIDLKHALSWTPGGGTGLTGTALQKYIDEVNKALGGALYKGAGGLSSEISDLQSVGGIGSGGLFSDSRAAFEALTKKQYGFDVSTLLGEIGGTGGIAGLLAQLGPGGPGIESLVGKMPELGSLGSVADIQQFLRDLFKYEAPGAGGTGTTSQYSSVTSITATQGDMLGAMLRTANDQRASMLSILRNEESPINVWVKGGSLGSAADNASRDASTQLRTQGVRIS